MYIYGRMNLYGNKYIYNLLPKELLYGCRPQDFFLFCFESEIDIF